MTIQEYVIQNYATLPKSTFEEEECVVVKEQRNEDWGWGHHDYEGIGIGPNGEVYWCFSSGCSCSGSCGREHQKDIKTFIIGDEDVLNTLKPEDVDFNALQVEFSNY